MKTNKKGDMTPFDMKKRPCRQSPLLLPIVWGASFLLTRRFGLKIKRTGMDGLKPPFLVISTHQGFTDYYIAPLSVFPHRASYISDMEGFAAFGDTLYRKIGCIGKRRFVTDMAVLNNIKYALNKNKDIVFVFPEARHSNVGTTSQLPNNLGRLVKYLKVPVAVLTVHGSYLVSPFWDEEHIRKAPVRAEIKLLYTVEELENTDEREIGERLKKELDYDEYKWQYDNKIKITCKNRAEGLSSALYVCKSCGSEFTMRDEGSTVFCTQCGEKWEMSEYGQLINQRSGEAVHIPFWYDSQRERVKLEIEEEGYRCEFPATVEALPNEKGFVPMGEGRLEHTRKGFLLEINGKKLFFPTRALPSVQTEYNYKGKGKCIVLSTKDCCYYVYSREISFNPTKLQFAAEWLYFSGRRTITNIVE
ncbi:MAG: 1-acyl-sn-glycerol-3-phosphate acyltransferase [Bacteroides sp.]|nr:1-acyl-sn-glycerol-3-phosphate acyltransferase [Bacteroides sp.]